MLYIINQDNYWNHRYSINPFSKSPKDTINWISILIYKNTINIINMANCRDRSNINLVRLIRR